MFILIDTRPVVREAYAAAFAREGVAVDGFSPADFDAWLEQPAADLDAVEGFLLGDDEGRTDRARRIRARADVPVIALIDFNALEQTLHLFAAGVDDVVRKPVHPRELLARCTAIRRRHGSKPGHADCGAVRVFFDGRDPQVCGETFALPRRERRILEYLVAHQGRRVTKAQIFNAIYGLFDDDVEEAVVESHVSKLRKKLRARMGRDPIESKRFLGYCLLASPAHEAPAASRELAFA